MKREEIRNLLPEITDEVLGKILDLNSRDIGKAKGDSEKLNEEIKTLKEQLTEKDTAIKGFENAQGDLEKIKTELENYKANEKKRLDDEKAAAHDKALTDAVMAAIGDKQFINEMTKNGYISEIKKALDLPENTGKGAKEIFETMTKDVEGIFKNPQQEGGITIPGANGNGNNEKTTFKNFF